VIKNKSLIIIYVEITLQSNSLQVDFNPIKTLRFNSINDRDHISTGIRDRAYPFATSASGGVNK